MALPSGKGVKYSGRGWIENVNERPVTVFAVGTNQEEKKKRRLEELAATTAGRDRQDVMQNPLATDGCYPGYIRMTQAECEAHAAKMGGTFGGVDIDSGIGNLLNAKGCSRAGATGSEYWFSDHATGGAVPDYFPICKNNPEYVPSESAYSQSLSGMNSCFDGYTPMTKPECKIKAGLEAANKNWVDDDNDSGGMVLLTCLIPSHKQSYDRRHWLRRSLCIY